MNPYNDLISCFSQLVYHESLRQEAREAGIADAEADHQLECTHYLCDIRLLKSQGVVFDLRVYLENTIALANESAGDVDALGSIFKDLLDFVASLWQLKTTLPELVQEFERLGLDEWLDLSADFDYLHKPACQFFQLLMNHILQERDIQFDNAEIAFRLGRLLGLDLPEVLIGFLQDVTHVVAAIRYDLNPLEGRQETQ